MKLTDEVIEKNFNTFINLLESNVKRDGIDKLIAYIKSKDTKIAPASTRYHLSCKGGLIAHSLNVYHRLLKLMEMEYPDKEIVAEDGSKTYERTCPYSLSTITVVALLHDMSKINFYEIQERNTKDEKGNWIKVPYYQVKDENSRLIFGSHSMNSYFMVNTFIKLDYEESLAILHHMGGIDSTEDTITCKNLSEAYKRSQLALFLHIADMLSTFSDESTEEIYCE